MGAGNQGLEALYRAYAPAIFARCLRIMGTEAEAADATQETFMRVRRQLERAPDAGEALRWIYRVATNYCLNQVRDRARQAVPSADLPEVPGPNLEDRLLDADLVRRLIAGLPAKVAQIAWLHHVEGLHQEEVAKTLEISRRTVVSRLGDFRRRAAMLAQGAR